MGTEMVIYPDEKEDSHDAGSNLNASQERLMPSQSQQVSIDSNDEFHNQEPMETQKQV